MVMIKYNDFGNHVQNPKWHFLHVISLNINTWDKKVISRRHQQITQHAGNNLHNCQYAKEGPSALTNWRCCGELNHYLIQVHHSWGGGKHPVYSVMWLVCRYSCDYCWCGRQWIGLHVQFSSSLCVIYCWLKHMFSIVLGWLQVCFMFRNQSNKLLTVTMRLISTIWNR